MLVNTVQLLLYWKKKRQQQVALSMEDKMSDCGTAVMVFRDVVVTPLGLLHYAVL